MMWQLSSGSWRKLCASLAAGFVAVLMTGCLTSPKPPKPEPGRLTLQLSPAALGASIALQQHLKVERNARIDELDTALEIDADHVQLVGLALGQRVLSLNYNGKELTSWRHVMLPSQVRAEDVLGDLQLVLWPVEAIRQALPEGWRIEEQGSHRTLLQDGDIVTSIDYSGQPRWSGTVVLENRRFHYRLTIQSAPIEP
jgi:hypothetical protein